MQRSLIANTALCATLCQAINTRLLHQATTQIISEEFLDIDFEEDYDSRRTVGQSTMAETSDHLVKGTGLAQVT